jgi:hypothetical protein
MLLLRRARASIRLAAVTAVLPWALATCAAPTLPLPPPEFDKLQQPAVVELQPGGQEVLIAGDGALRTGDIEIVMLNEELGLARFVRPDSHGHYEGLVPVNIDCAQPSNHVDMWQRRFDGTESPPIVVTVPRTSTRAPDAGCPDAGEDAGAEPANDAPEKDAAAE